MANDSGEDDELIILRETALKSRNYHETSNDNGSTKHRNSKKPSSPPPPPTGANRSSSSCSSSSSSSYSSYSRERSHSASSHSSRSGSNQSAYSSSSSSPSNSPRHQTSNTKRLHHLSKRSNDNSTHHRSRPSKGPPHHHSRDHHYRNDRPGPMHSSHKRPMFRGRVTKDDRHHVDRSGPKTPPPKQVWKQNVSLSPPGRPSPRKSPRRLSPRRLLPRRPLPRKPSPSFRRPPSKRLSPSRSSPRRPSPRRQSPRRPSSPKRLMPPHSSSLEPHSRLISYSTSHDRHQSDKHNRGGVRLIDKRPRDGPPSKDDRGVVDVSIKKDRERDRRERREHRSYKRDRPPPTAVKKDQVVADRISPPKDRMVRDLSLEGIEDISPAGDKSLLEEISSESVSEFKQSSFEDSYRKLNEDENMELSTTNEERSTTTSRRRSSSGQNRDGDHRRKRRRTDSESHSAKMIKTASDQEGADRTDGAIDDLQFDALDEELDYDESMDDIEHYLQEEDEDHVETTVKSEVRVCPPSPIRGQENDNELSSMKDERCVEVVADEEQLMISYSDKEDPPQISVESKDKVIQEESTLETVAPEDKLDKPDDDSDNEDNVPIISSPIRITPEPDDLSQVAHQQHKEVLLRGGPNDNKNNLQPKTTLKLSVKERLYLSKKDIEEKARKKEDYRQQHKISSDLLRRLGPLPNERGTSSRYSSKTRSAIAIAEAFRHKKRKEGGLKDNQEVKKGQQYAKILNEHQTRADSNRLIRKDEDLDKHINQIRSNNKRMLERDEEIRKDRQMHG